MVTYSLVEGSPRALQARSFGGIRRFIGEVLLVENQSRGTTRHRQATAMEDHHASHVIREIRQ
jgi:hypothetical protein